MRHTVGSDAWYLFTFSGDRSDLLDEDYMDIAELRAAMEMETETSLERFFERWIYGSTLPKLKVGYRTEGTDVILQVEQIGEVFDVPLTIELQYADRKPVDVLVAVTDRTVEKRVPLGGVLRGIDVSKDDGTMAEIVKN